MIGWQIVKNEGYRHILPVGEEHQLEECKCNPIVDDDLIIHNSYDKRESYENGRKMS
jgi:hypothetical protein